MDRILLNPVLSVLLYTHNPEPGIPFKDTEGIGETLPLLLVQTAASKGGSGQKFELPTAAYAKLVCEWISSLCETSNVGLQDPEPVASPAGAEAW